jgi:hypothetical protein
MSAIDSKKVALAGGLTAGLLGAFLLGGAALGGVGASTPSALGTATAIERGAIPGTPAVVEQEDAPEQVEAPVGPARATITEDQARQAALARYPGGRVAKATLEDEDGTLVWEITLIDASGQAHGVTVDATGGQVLGIRAGEHEGPEGSEGPEDDD